MNPVERFRLDGRIALVTGASSGLGAHFATVLAGAGASAARPAVILTECASRCRSASMGGENRRGRWVAQPPEREKRWR